MDLLTATEVLPQLARTGRHTPEAPPTPVAPPPPPPPTVGVHARVAPAVAATLRWASATLGGAHEAVAATLLAQWTECVAFHLREGPAARAGRRGHDNRLMVRVSDFTHEVLSRCFANLGAPSPASRSTSPPPRGRSRGTPSSSTP